jgi:hypothetical protein
MSFCEGFFMMFAIFQVQYFSLQLTHNMTPREGFTLFGSVLNFLCLFQTILKTASMKLLSPGLSLAKLEVDL